MVSLAGVSCETYTPGALLANHRQPWSQGRRLDCLDIAVELMNDPRVAPGGTLLDLTFGNRCELPIHVDLSHVRVEAHYGESKVERFEMYDPRHEIGPRLLGGFSSGREGIEIDPHTPQTEMPQRLCVSVADVVTAVDATRAGPPLCFVLQRGNWYPEVEQSEVAR